MYHIPGFMPKWPWREGIIGSMFKFMATNTRTGTHMRSHNILHCSEVAAPSDRAPVTCGEWTTLQAINAIIKHNEHARWNTQPLLWLHQRQSIEDNGSKGKRATDYLYWPMKCFTAKEACVVSPLDTVALETSMPRSAGSMMNMKIYLQGFCWQ